ncbi:TPA: hypothetical protein N0F65_006693 [Lagenidium giganteum]|uniref:Uncharacterized protein n=1 Tax=Lagenidium giganteum TaxID=4803 RepID=A0AAV2Z853_9STRA|nr:TPA: hypothetical protein N0F65_006693 [Lagenidium giganteum]
MPWLSTSSATPCAVYTFDCLASNSSTPTAIDLVSLDSVVLVTLNFVHCPELVIPPHIQNFSYLVGINVKHCGLANWGIDAAITQDSHPRMMFIIFANVSLSGVPDGIRQNIPYQLADIEFSHTNLSIIPSDLNESWPNVGSLYIEYSDIHDVPASLMDITLTDLSLIGNRLETIPALAKLPASIGFVALDNNPLVTLPDTFDNAEEFVISEFSAENTNVTTIPSTLLNTDKVHFLYMHGTPYCKTSGENDQAPVAARLIKVMENACLLKQIAPLETSDKGLQLS